MRQHVPSTQELDHEAKSLQGDGVPDAFASRYTKAASMHQDAKAELPLEELLLLASQCIRPSRPLTVLPHWEASSAARLSELLSIVFNV